MALIAAWTNFLGANRRVVSKRLPEGFGDASLFGASPIIPDNRLGSGDMRAWPDTVQVVTLGGAANSRPVTIYRLNRDVISDTSDWLWWNLDVDVVRSLVPSDTTYEIFYTGDGAPKRTTSTLALPATPAPAASRPLGIPAPGAQFNVATLVAGSGPLETRSYIDTFVTTDGLKEGAPNSTPRTVSVAGGTTMTLGSGASFAAVPGGYADVTLRRVYVSTSGSEYLLCAEGLASAGTLTDSLSRTTVLQSGGATSRPAWLEPQSTMKGLIGLWNGMVGGFVGKELCICEPFKPWAWPAEYRIPLHDEIVGTGMWGQNWVVITTAGPYIVTGSSPLNMNPNKLPFDLGGASKRSVVSMLNGVGWASENGFCYMGDGHPPQNITEAFITPEDWRDLYPPSTIIASRFEDYCVLNADRSGQPKNLIIGPQTKNVGLNVGAYTGSAAGMFYDTVSDRLYIARPNDTGKPIYRYAKDPATSIAAFVTKKVRNTKPCNAGYMLVIASYGGFGVTVHLYVDEVLKGTFTSLSERPIPLPGGYKGRDFQVLIQSTVPVQGVLLAEDAADFP